MSGYQLRSKAKADLKNIGRYTLKRWGKKQRDRYLALIVGCFQKLDDEPFRGKDSGLVRVNYRQYAVGRHVIFFREMPKGHIEIVRVLHGVMDMQRHFLTEDDD